MKGIMMTTWLLLVSLFNNSTQDGNGQESGVLHCGPQNLTLTSSGQMLLIRWDDKPSCSGLQDKLIYKLVVLIDDKQVHHEEVAVLPDHIGSTHSWNWTSYLPLKCASHSVRLSYKNHTSPLEQELTHPAVSGSVVFPIDRMFKVGSEVTFYCILPAGEDFNKMYLSGYSSDNINIIETSSHIYAGNVTLNQASIDSCTNVYCETNKKKHGACAYIGYPPDYSDFQCETQDLESVECYWTERRNPGVQSKCPTVNLLLGSPCANQLKERCSQKVKVNVGERNWTFTAHNGYGKLELSDTADLTKRVHMFPPKDVTASTVNARNVSLVWRWTVPQYNNLNITCQINISCDENTISESFGVGLKFVVLNDLIPNWTYNVTIRCGTTQHFWKWSDWSTTVSLLTKSDVPDALDVWMQMKENQIITIWKVPLANQSHGHIEDYDVSWTKTSERERQNRTKVASNNHSLHLSLDTTEEYIVTVTARNKNGSSSPSIITIPSLKTDRTRVNTSWIIGSNGSFSLSWSASPTASCGYIVDWCPTSGHCIVEWLKVPPNETTANIFTKTFKDGLRYSLSIYACTPGAPELLEIREGYVREQKIQEGLFKSLKGKQLDSDYEVSWEPISLKEQTAFIQGYVLYCLDNNNNNNITKFSTDDPDATSLTARNLKISTYTFRLEAQTAVGECGTAYFTATMNSLTGNLIMAVSISLVAVFGLLVLTTIIFYRQWSCIKQKVYPPIPKPVLTSVGEHLCRPLHVDECYYSEAYIMDVPELHLGAGAPFNGYNSQENMPFVFTQTPKGYYNQPLTLPITATPSQSGLPSSPFRGAFPNRSYKLVMQPGDQFNSGPKLQEGTSLERSSDEYQPQDPAGTFTVNQTEEDPESPMSCVSTYILLPQSHCR